MKNSIIQIAVSAFVFFALVACQSTNDANTAKESSDGSVATEKISIACSGTAVPYSYIEDNVHKGFEVDMWNEIAKRENFEVEMKTTGFSAIFGMLDSGQVDVAGNFFGMSEERLKKYDASDPYAVSSVAVVTNTDNTDIKTIHDLKGKKVAASEGTQGMELAKNKQAEIGYELIVYEATGTTAMQELHLRRVDALIESEMTIRIDSKAAGLEFRYLDDKVSTTKVAYFFRKEDEKSKEKMDRVNKALAEMLKDGTVKTLSEKWFNTDVTQGL